MRRIWAVIIAGIVSGCSTWSGSAPLIQLRLVGSERGVEAAERAYFNDEEVYLHPQAVISDQDITHVGEAIVQGGAVVFDVRLSAEGAERLRSTTAENIGRPMAILFDGEVVSIPVIRDELGMGRAHLAIPVESEEQGEEVIRRVRARWPTQASLPSWPWVEGARRLAAELHAAPGP
jgi:hypothetical protein